MESQPLNSGIILKTFTHKFIIIVNMPPIFHVAFTGTYCGQKLTFRDKYSQPFNFHIPNLKVQSCPLTLRGP